MRLFRGAVAFVAGFVIVALEFAAIRLMAPQFGQSTWIWANVIGVILAALVVGYRLGGRTGLSSSSFKPLTLYYVVASCWIVGAVLWGPSFMAGMMPSGVFPDRTLPLAFWPSLATTVLLFAPPVVLAATTSPILVQRDARRGAEGSSAGWIYAIGTLGSLAGCYAAPIYMLPWWGTRLTCFVLAGLLFVLGLVLYFVPTKSTDASSRATPVSGSQKAPRRLFLVALAMGLAITVIEFAAIRMMSPWVGQSNLVWANVIGVCLLSIAIGSHLGGRFIDARPQSLPFARILAIAAGWLLLALALTPIVMEWLVPVTLSNAYVLGVSLWGSLAATLLLFAPPLTVAGMAVPVVIRLASPQGRAGAVAGRVFAWNTVGGLIGCVISASLLVPAIGSRATIALSAVLLTLCAWSLGTRPIGETTAKQTPRGKAMTFGGALALSVAALLTLAIWRPALLHDKGQLAEVESAYQTIRAAEQMQVAVYPAKPPSEWQPTNQIPMRFLRHDEDHETYQSAWLKDKHATQLTGGRYFEHMAIGAQFYRAQRKDKRLDVLIIGHAGGTVYRVLRDTVPKERDLHCIAVELDPEVVNVARAYLDHKTLEDERLTLITGEDGRTVVNALPDDRRFDLILVDAYTRTNYVPFQLASREFFAHVQGHLKPGGWLGLNVLGGGAKSPVARAVSATANDVLGSAFLTPNPSFPGNVIIWASPNAPRGPRVDGGATLHPQLRTAVFALERLTWRFRSRENELLLTDDRSPAEQIADEEFGL